MFFELVILTIVIGAVYGYLKSGREDRTSLFKKGALIGIILALALVILSGLLSGGKMLLESGVVGTVIFVDVILLAALFIIGTFIGDWLEEKTKSA